MQISKFLSCHSWLDQESRDKINKTSIDFFFHRFWIPAFVGMTLRDLGSLRYFSTNSLANPVYVEGDSFKSLLFSSFGISNPLMNFCTDSLVIIFPRVSSLSFS